MTGDWKTTPMTVAEPIAPRPKDTVDRHELEFKQEYPPFVTKDSGVREEFSTGMVRDTQENKPRYDLIPTGPLKRLAELYMRGAIKYSENNWKKGQPYSRAYASMFRHMVAWREGEASEDHLAAICFNAFALMYYEQNSPELDDIFGGASK